MLQRRRVREPPLPPPCSLLPLRLVAAAVAGAEGAAPVTVKFRIGLTPQLTTHLQARSCPLGIWPYGGQRVRGMLRAT